MLNQPFKSKQSGNIVRVPYDLTDLCDLTVHCLYIHLNSDWTLVSPVCIVGPNGVGKSTLLLLLTGKLNPVSVLLILK